MRTGLFDIETDGLLPDLTRVWCAVVKDLDDGTVTKFDPDNIGDLTNLLDSFDCLIGHNVIGFDMPALRKVYAWTFKGQVIDTVLMSRMQRPRRRSPPMGKWSTPHSLAAWGYRVGRGKVEHDEWDKYTPAMLHRCAEDVEVLELTYHALLEEGKGEGWDNCHRLNARLFTLLQQQQEYGWLVDQPHMDRCIYFLTRWMGLIDGVVVPKLPLVVEVKEGKKDGSYNYVRKPFKKDGTYSAATEKWLQPIIDGGDRSLSVGGPFSRVSFRPTDITKRNEIVAYLLANGWEPAEWNTNNEGKRTSPKLSKDDPFRGVEGALGRLVAKRTICRARLSILEGWKAHIRDDGRIASVVTGLATTGRAKHSVIVNVPSPHSNAFFARWMRAVFIAKPGWVLVGCDSKGNQIRQLAARMNEPEFTEAVLRGRSEDGTDIHSVNQRKTGASTRTKAKNFFYGFIFGAQPPRIAKELGCPLAEATSIRDNYLEGLPGLKKLIEDRTAEWRASAKRFYNKKFGRMQYQDGWIKGLDGRPIQAESEHMVLCYLLQSDEAIQLAAAYSIWHKWMDERWEYGKQWGTVIWYHDEWQFECEPEIAEDAGALAAAAIKWAGEYYKIQCPHDGDYSIGNNWSETH
jgi:hypothetical protein